MTAYFELNLHFLEGAIPKESPEKLWNNKQISITGLIHKHKSLATYNPHKMCQVCSKV